MNFFEWFWIQFTKIFFNCRNLVSCMPCLVLPAVIGIIPLVLMAVIGSNHDHDDREDMSNLLVASTVIFSLMFTIIFCCPFWIWIYSCCIREVADEDEGYTDDVELLTPFTWGCCTKVGLNPCLVSIFPAMICGTMIVMGSWLMIMGVSREPMNMKIINGAFVLYFIAAICLLLCMIILCCGRVINTKRPKVLPLG